MAPEIPRPLEHPIETNGSAPKKPLRTRPLTSVQERRLTTYLDEKILELTRGYKKHHNRRPQLKLHAYLSAARHLLSFILQIPPVDPSTSLRTTYMLRITGDVLAAVCRYPLTAPPTAPEDHTEDAMDTSPDWTASNANRPAATEADLRSTLTELIDLLDDLDQAWFAVLQRQIWDPDEGAGVYLVLDATIACKSTPVTQTDIARLRSIIVGSEEVLDVWLEEERVSMSRNVSGRRCGNAFDRWGLLGDFDELFHRALDFLDRG
ncbi:hypothetical protein BDQ17DRAFT_1300603 [Cyathus striatus]|nr:hypothetical protein BDQ17DRAFT_1300603 [Cyathus striatus]